MIVTDLDTARGLAQGRAHVDIRRARVRFYYCAALDTGEPAPACRRRIDSAPDGWRQVACDQVQVDSVRHRGRITGVGAGAVARRHRRYPRPPHTRAGWVTGTSRHLPCTARLPPWKWCCGIADFIRANHHPPTPTRRRWYGKSSGSTRSGRLGAVYLDLRIGLYRADINGQPVSDYGFVPGWTKARTCLPPPDGLRQPAPPDAPTRSGRSSPTVVPRPPQLRGAGTNGSSGCWPSWSCRPDRQPDRLSTTAPGPPPAWSHRPTCTKGNTTTPGANSPAVCCGFYQRLAALLGYLFHRHRRADAPGVCTPAEVPVQPGAHLAGGRDGARFRPEPRRPRALRGTARAARS